MGKRRLESFSDGVLAIIITIMVLDLKKPSGDKLDDLLTLWPTGCPQLVQNLASSFSGEPQYSQNLGIVV